MVKIVLHPDNPGLNQYKLEEECARELTRACIAMTKHEDYEIKVSSCLAIDYFRLYIKREKIPYAEVEVHVWEVEDNDYVIMKFNKQGVMHSSTKNVGGLFAWPEACNELQDVLMELL